MANNRIARTNDDIQRVLSNRIGSIKDPRVNQGGMITITRVETTGDLRYCKVWVSVLGSIDEKEFKKGLKSASGYLRRELGRTLNLRHTPEVQWALDDSITYGAHMLEIINNLPYGEHNDEE